MTDTNGSLNVTITDEHDGLVTRYVIVAEVVEPDGAESLRIHTSEGMADWTTLGLLTFAAAARQPDFTEEDGR